MTEFATGKCSQNQPITLADIRHHYYMCARRTHPDAGSMAGASDFSAVHDAYQALLNAATTEGTLEPSWVRSQLHRDPTAHLIDVVISKFGKWFSSAPVSANTNTSAPAPTPTDKSPAVHPDLEQSTDEHVPRNPSPTEHEHQTPSHEHRSRPEYSPGDLSSEPLPKQWTITLTPSLADIWQKRVYKITVSPETDPLLVPSWNRLSVYSDADPVVQCDPVISEEEAQTVHLTEFNDVLFTGARASDLCRQYLQYSRSGVRGEPKGSLLVWRGAGPPRPNELDVYGDVFLVVDPGA